MATGIANSRISKRSRLEAKRSHAMGLTGAMCIHPNSGGAEWKRFGVSRRRSRRRAPFLRRGSSRVDGVASRAHRQDDRPAAGAGGRGVSWLLPGNE